MDYNFSYTDFISLPILDDFQYELDVLFPSNPSSLVRTGDESIFSLQIHFNTELSPGELTQLNTLIQTYNPAFSSEEARLSYTTILNKQLKGVNGGTFINGIWQTRVLTDISGNTYCCRIASNQIRLVEGTYEIKIRACCYGVGANQLRLYNITNNTIVCYGETHFSSVDINAYTMLNTNLVVATTPQMFEIQHMCENTQTNVGFGKACGFGDEVYLHCHIIIL